MKVCIIAVGSELLLGQIVNTNAQFVSQKFNEAGHHVLEHIVVGDNAQRLENVTRRALQQYDVLVFTGGLGPTKDDLTKQTVADVLNQKLVMNQEAMDYIEHYFKQHGKVMTPNNKQQALVIEGAEVLANKVGMAPGIYVQHDNRHIVMLPGPPKELQPMVVNELMPYFSQGGQTIESEVLRFSGMGESQVETELMDLIDAQSNPTIAPLAGTHEVTIRLTASGENTEMTKQRIAPIKEEILKRIGLYYYGSDDMTPERAVLALQRQTFAVYDQVTDGLLHARLKQEDTKHLLKGYMLHHPQFIDDALSIKGQLYTAAYFVQALYESEQSISLLSKNNTVYIGLLNGDTFHIKTFQMAQMRHLQRDRSQNYILITWLNWLKHLDNPSIIDKI
ncbi:CinA family nicotinamide mononucleotide deamidase-related protein [Staphylococcus intermedius]|uniref:Putative competence-damage inducible protein n=1 Tax=Staphylococcus intermedius NCTC 11048 TaxID=1141106 RepID=A0A380G809_STAIN|nr:CinA family nicotinamide mononucleotide deamidase-related protein [Staphylococcus intermedius]PCF65038.1 competence/damage-inducible protein A [Staphylococcus intermedius]PCF80649.1 competence/damage-inducible protein A [Staphylococcus intermedius]PCF81998.1 competence/damage-inducible protein A [Staphylococcus intermedius]PCF89049.1 competence/damage-inducible protein A [Staphylococcus intermedius]PNZ51741.1 competence/damage-inducible protein A [Staphylococcus intermedius NCTC 11048]